MPSLSLSPSSPSPPAPTRTPRHRDHSYTLYTQISTYIIKPHPQHRASPHDKKNHLQSPTSGHSVVSFQQFLPDRAPPMKTSGRHTLLLPGTTLVYAHVLCKSVNVPLSTQSPIGSWMQRGQSVEGSHSLHTITGYEMRRRVAAVERPAKPARPKMAVVKLGICILLVLKCCSVEVFEMSVMKRKQEDGRIADLFYLRGRLLLRARCCSLLVADRECIFWNSGVVW
jgi:hypothetical protein